MKKVIVIGGGAAGMMAAVRAAEKGHTVTVLEKNEKLGKKLYITGKGRCNITNGCDTASLFHNVKRNSKFLYSAFYCFDNFQIRNFMEQNGVKTKVERGDRVFPQSDHSSDVIRLFERLLNKYGVAVRLRTEVKKIEPQAGGFLVMLSGNETLSVDAVIIATGGCSYQATGSTGDGYRFARQLGHRIEPLMPSLVPMNAAQTWVKELQGLALKNVSIAVKDKQHVLYDGFGEMLFTHFGVSGPLILSASSVINDYADKMPLSLQIDLKPALSLEQLEQRILREFDENKNKTFSNAVQKLFPARLTPVMVQLSGILADKKVNMVTRAERQRFVSLIKGLPLTLTGLRSFQEAVITRGGISIQDVNPSTMESKVVKGLYFAGEVLDVDALTGGFNLQIAWSTGYLAGDSII